VVQSVNRTEKFGLWLVFMIALLIVLWLAGVTAFYLAFVVCVALLSLIAKDWRNAECPHCGALHGERCINPLDNDEELPASHPQRVKGKYADLAGEDSPWAELYDEKKKEIDAWIEKTKAQLWGVCGGGFLMSMGWAAFVGYSEDYPMRFILISNAILCGLCYAVYWFEDRRLTKSIEYMKDPGDGPTEESS